MGFDPKEQLAVTKHEQAEVVDYEVCFRAEGLFELRGGSIMMTAGALLAPKSFYELLIEVLDRKKSELCQAVLELAEERVKAAEPKVDATYKVTWYTNHHQEMDESTGFLYTTSAIDTALTMLEEGGGYHFAEIREVPGGKMVWTSDNHPVQQAIRKVLAKNSQIIRTIHGWSLQDVQNFLSREAGKTKGDQ